VGRGRGACDLRQYGACEQELLHAATLPRQLNWGHPTTKPFLCCCSQATARQDFDLIFVCSRSPPWGERRSCEDQETCSCCSVNRLNEAQLDGRREDVVAGRLATHKSGTWLTRMIDSPPATPGGCLC